jgi:hypothetical protein
MLSPNLNRETKLLRDFGEDQFLFTKRSSRRNREGCNACSTGGGEREFAYLIEETEFPNEAVFATVRRVPAVCGQDVVSASGGAVCSGPLALTHQTVAPAGKGLTREASFLLS